MLTIKGCLSVCFVFVVSVVSAQKLRDSISRPKGPDSLKNLSLPALSFRSIGPAVTGGRVVDLAVNPKNPREYYVASGHGSLWKTMNNGVTFTPAFENQGSFSMGCVRIDPSNTNIVLSLIHI